MPGATYGPGDSSQLGDQVRQAMRGRLPYLSFPTLGVNAVHVEDVAAGPRCSSTTAAGRARRTSSAAS